MGSESNIVPIDDVEDVKTAAADDEIVLHEAQIVAVSQLDSFKVCLRVLKQEWSHHLMTMEDTQSQIAGCCNKLTSVLDTHVPS